MICFCLLCTYSATHPTARSTSTPTSASSPPPTSSLSATDTSRTDDDHSTTPYSPPPPSPPTSIAILTPTFMIFSNSFAWECEANFTPIHWWSEGWRRFREETEPFSIGFFWWRVEGGGLPRWRWLDSETIWLNIWLFQRIRDFSPFFGR